MDFELRTADGVEGPAIFADFMQRYEMAYSLELEHFLNVVEGANRHKHEHKRTNKSVISS